MVNIIVAVCNDLGIGINGTIPWHISEDLRHFKTTTTNGIVVMGSRTYFSVPVEHRPFADGRTTVVITRNVDEFWKKERAYLKDHKDLVVCTIDEFMLFYYPSYKTTRTIWIAGGSWLYEKFLPYADKIYLTMIEKAYACDRYFPALGTSWQMFSFSTRHYDSTENVHYRFALYKRCGGDDVGDNERQYLDLAKDIINHGNRRNNRTNVGTLSVFGRQMRFNISRYVPLLTTKRVPWKGCIEELLWFLRGDTDAKILQQRGLRIWDGNSSREFLDKSGLAHLETGDCGANYSFQWRHFGATYKDCHSDYTGQGFDQVNNVLQLLREDPYSRRIFMSAWNPCDLNKTVLPPCHVSAQFYVEEDANGVKHLSCHMYQRSCDLFLGEPWNILSYSILTYILAKKTGMYPKELIISTGDTHIYNNHIAQVNEQLNRHLRTAPVLWLSDSVATKDWNELSIDDFQIIGYYPHSAIKAEMAV